MTVDYKKLNQNLNKMTGYDYEKAEEEARMLGAQILDVALSKTFHAVLAAKALGVPPDDIRALPLREYQRVTNTVGSFLFGGADQDAEALQEKSENVL